MIASPAIEWVRVVAVHLGDMRDDVVFLGGATVGLLITDPAAPTVRSTKDVDVIVEVGSWGEYAPLQERLRLRGFTEDTEEGAPLCRWVVKGIKVDVMPTSDEILGFSNSWYRPAMQTAQSVQLEDGITIRVVTAAHFLATKLEAFHSRGEGDYQLSHDMEDLIAVVDGRPTLAKEIERADTPLRNYLRVGVSQLLAEPAFREALTGHLPGDTFSQQRLPVLVQRLEQIARGDPA